MNTNNVALLVLLVSTLTLHTGLAMAQISPSRETAAQYTGLHKAAYAGDLAALRNLTAAGGNLEARDSNGRTPVHAAAFQSHDDALRHLVQAGADINALDSQAYDVITIAAVADDVALLRTALELGGNPGNITSPYDGTALIAAAHLGHAEVVRVLIAAGAPLDHVNNLGWTALMESVVLGDGGERHVQTARALIEAGADTTLGDRGGVAPLTHARQRGFVNMAALFPAASH